jgi:hypothetical protein
VPRRDHSRGEEHGQQQQKAMEALKVRHSLRDEDAECTCPPTFPAGYAGWHAS